MTLISKWSLSHTGAVTICGVKGRKDFFAESISLNDLTSTFICALGASLYWYQVHVGTHVLCPETLLDLRRGHLQSQATQSGHTTRTIVISCNAKHYCHDCSLLYVRLIDGHQKLQSGN